jgi:hypothetical protein
MATDFIFCHCRFISSLPLRCPFSPPAPAMRAMPTMTRSDTAAARPHSSHYWLAISTAFRLPPFRHAAIIAFDDYAAAFAYAADTADIFRH